MKSNWDSKLRTSVIRSLFVYEVLNHNIEKLIKKLFIEMKIEIQKEKIDNNKHNQEKNLHNV